ncbi:MULTISPECIES: hypothetical protein [unclassified Enterobacter]|nr:MULTISPECIES: hypothetical protein [unclassified Enterobacter]MCR1304882.1 hypothetical protein [Enterobacter sp. FL1277]MCR1306005.1 hypothetical protein [Enterobacter sp. BT1271]
MLIGRALPEEMARVIEDLLCELVGYYADTLKAPRWINTPESHIAIN